LWRRQHQRGYGNINVNQLNVMSKISMANGEIILMWLRIYGVMAKMTIMAKMASMAMWRNNNEMAWRMYGV